MSNLNLQCQCGLVKGLIKNVSQKTGNRCICFCDDCKAFPTQLGVKELVLDEYGGTELFQVPLSKVEIIEGIDKLRCLRLTQKGLYRWYTHCCNTPIGNTINSNIPFFGIIHSFIDSTDNLNEMLGYIYGAVHIKNAKVGYEKPKYFQSEFRVNLRVLSKILKWKVKGFNKPSAFFDSNGKTVSVPMIVNQSKD